MSATDEQLHGGAETICPLNYGRHKMVMTQWGRVCVACHKTWQWVAEELVPTWNLTTASTLSTPSLRTTTGGEG
jgi:hypothetical protein